MAWAAAEYCAAPHTGTGLDSSGVSIVGIAVAGGDGIDGRVIGDPCKGGAVELAQRHMATAGGKARVGGHGLAVGCAGAFGRGDRDGKGCGPEKCETCWHACW